MSDSGDGGARMDRTGPTMLTDLLVNHDGTAAQRGVGAVIVDHVPVWVGDLDAERVGRFRFPMTLPGPNRERETVAAHAIQGARSHGLSGRPGNDEPLIALTMVGETGGLELKLEVPGGYVGTLVILRNKSE